MDFSASADSTPYQTITVPIQPLNQCSLTNTGNQIGSLGFFLLLFMVSYLCFKQWHRKHYGQQACALHQQVEMLERMWRLRTHQKP